MKIKDGDWSLYDYDIQSGRQVWVMHHDDGRMTFRTDYPVQPAIDQNTAQRNIAQSGWKGDYHQIASVPLNIYYDQLAQASQQNDEKYISKWLNSSDNRAWRTKAGRV